MELYEHNQIAYQEADKMLKTYGCAAVIHPTGTGKSFIAFKLIEEHPDAQFLWLSPNDIFRAEQIQLFFVHPNQPGIGHMNDIVEIAADIPPLAFKDIIIRGQPQELRIGVGRTAGELV